MTLRIFIAVTHLLGAGHLTRAAALARALAGAGHETTLVSGGMPFALIAGAGFEFVQLPPVRTAGSDFRALLDEAGHAIATERLARRRTMLLEAFRAAKPDVVITELFPFGRRVLAKEFIALLEEAHRRKPRPLVVSSARDILVAPAKPERVAENGAAADVELTAADLRAIDEAAGRITVTGARYPEALEKMTNR